MQEVCVVPAGTSMLHLSRRLTQATHALMPRLGGWTERMAPVSFDAASAVGSAVPSTPPGVSHCSILRCWYSCCWVICC